MRSPEKEGRVEGLFENMSRREKQLALLGGIGFLFFLFVAFLVATGRMDGFDAWVQDRVFAMRSPALTAFMVPFTCSCNWQAIVPLCALLLIVPATRSSYGVPVTLAASTSMLFYYSLKYAFTRMRPHPSLHLLEQGGYSFPSGHSLTSFLVYGMIALLLLYYARTGGANLPIYREQKRAVPHIRSEQRALFICILLAFYVILMGFSRIYTGVHWPSDVLGSWLLALPLLVGLRRLIRI
jgi:undecaprenyl-diphosphatase